jgi:hypothetical protein
MQYKLIPPTEDFFSQQWYDSDGFGMRMMTDDLYSRIDSTRRKLNELESKLGQRLGSERYNPDLRSFLDRVGWLRGYIGVWTTDGERWDVQMAYPHTKRAISRWPDELFGERKEGNVLILLSSSVITWLNAIDKWVSSSYSTSTTTV